MSSTAWQRVEEPRVRPRRVLLLGSTGMVGRSWAQLLRAQGIEHTALHRPEFDLQDPDSIDRAMRDQYDLVINAAAWTDVDGAEAEGAMSEQANAHAVAHIAQRSDAMGSMLITYSTDYVFAGNARAPYPIDAPIKPLNVYGRSKALGESLLRECTDRHILIRTSWVYAPWGKNFVLTMRSLMAERSELKVVNDQHGRPSSALELAQGSLELYRYGAAGTWHLTDNGECTWFDFATHIAASIGSSCRVESCDSDAFPRTAKRPAYSTLDIQPTQGLIGEQSHWSSRVDDVLKAIHTLDS